MSQKLQTQLKTDDGTKIFNKRAERQKCCRVRAALENWQKKREDRQEEKGIREEEKVLSGEGDRGAKGKAPLEQWRANLLPTFVGKKGKAITVSVRVVSVCACVSLCEHLAICASVCVH